MQNSMQGRDILELLYRGDSLEIFVDIERMDGIRECEKESFGLHIFEYFFLD